MNNLLKEAIADAKAVRETALANAKIALEEAFTPRLQSMLSARLAEEAEDEEMYEEEEMEPTETNEEEYMEDGQDGTPASGLDEEDEMEEEGLDLESIIRELEGEMEMEEGEGEEADVEMEVEPAEEEPVAEGEEEEMEEDIDINEIIRSLTEEDGEETEEEPVSEAEESEESSKELEEAYRVIKFMRSKLNEVNLLNAKLLFSNKLFRNYALNEGQKMKVIENFDRASSIREVKLVYSTICESLNTVNKKKQNIKESYASKPAGKSTAPKKEILSEGDALAARWKKLANLK
jgi:hypothetical protein